MSTLNLDSLLAPIFPDQPSGANLEYEAAFQELQQSALGKPEQQMGDAVIPAEEPNWGTVLERATALTQQTKDIRVLSLLIRALVKTQGFPGLADGLALLRAVVEQQWSTLHPQLDADDNNDATMRVNAFAALADMETTIRDLREAEAVKAQGFGRFTLRDTLVAAGKLPVGDPARAASPAAIEAAFSAVPVAELLANATGAAAALDHATAALKVFHAQLGPGNSPQIELFINTLKEARAILAEQAARRGATTTTQAGESATPVTVAATAEIRTREDVVRALQRCIDYFKRQEPSSPVPLLLERAQKLVTMNFVDLVRDLAPDGLKQVELFRGKQE